MIYKQQEPTFNLKNIVKSFWLIDSENDTTIRQEKIIPDGYPEFIFHYNDSYSANVLGSWFEQEKYLVAGQIKNHFFLENTGKIGMFGIKFQPWALKLLFDLDMHLLSNTVIGISEPLQKSIKPVIQIAISKSLFEDKVKVIEHWFNTSFHFEKKEPHKGQKATKIIIKSKGEISIQEILDTVDLSERALERYFKTHIGLSPKFYSRIIRFSNIFNLVQIKNFNWSDVTYLAGFYDQSHFIKNFKEFTGEEPSKYGFTEENMANFFLKK